MIIHRLAARTARTSAAALVGAAALSALPLVGAAEAKLPGHEYCFHGTCHRVASITETEAMVGRELTLSASFYDDCKQDRFNPCGLTSSGEPFRPEKPDNAASPVFPDGTTLLLFNPRTKGAAVVRVNNAGPYWGKRKLDVSRAAAEKLGFRRVGVAELQVRVINAPSKAEAKYKKNRRYGRVPGFLGRYANIADAHRGMASVMALEAMASSLMAPLTGGLVVAARGDAPLPSLVASPVAEAPVVEPRVAQARVTKSHVAQSRVAKTQSAARLKAGAKAHAKSKLKTAALGRKPKLGAAAKAQRHLADTPVLSRQALAAAGTVG